MTEPTPIEDQLRAWADDAADQVPPWSPAAPLTAPAPPNARRRWLLVGAAAAALVVVAAVGWRVVDEQRGGVAVTAASGGQIEVEYERSEYIQRAELQCTPREQETTPTFARAVYETWADRTGKRWRTTVTYPDGSTLDTIDLGSPYYPTEELTRGRDAGAVLGCDDVILAAAPSGGSVNLMAEVPMVQTPWDSEPFPAVQPFPGNDRTRVAGDHVDSRNRPGERWRSSTSGFDDRGRPIEQVHEWVVERDTDRILEVTTTMKHEGVGSAEQRRTVVEHGIRQVDASIFDTDGYESRGGRPIPPSTAESEKTVVAEGKTDGGEPWTVSAFHRRGEVCVEFAKAPSSSTSCDANPGPVIAQLATLGEDRVLFGMTMPGVASLRVDHDGGEPLTRPTSSRGLASFGHHFYGFTLPAGLEPTRITGFDAAGKELFVSPPLQVCPGGGGTTGIAVCRLDA